MNEALSIRPEEPRRSGQPRDERSARIYYQKRAETLFAALKAADRENAQLKRDLIHAPARVATLETLRPID